MIPRFEVPQATVSNNQTKCFNSLVNQQIFEPIEIVYIMCKKNSE